MTNSDIYNLTKSWELVDATQIPPSDNPIMKKYASMSDSKSPGCKKKFPKFFKKPWKSSEDKDDKRKSGDFRTEHFV